MAYLSTNPFTGKVEKRFDDISATALEEKMAAAHNCFKSDWSARSYADRTAILKRAAALMRERAQPLAELITLEMGKLIVQSLGERVETLTQRKRRRGGRQARLRSL